MNFRFFMRHRRCLSTIFWLNLALSLIAGLVCSPEAVLGDQVSRWTGRHTRLVWIQDHGDGTDALAHRKYFKLYGYDSEDGLGERPLLEIVDNFFKPLLTPDGSKVVFSNRLTRRMYLLDWESGNIKELGSGVAVAIWQDPKPSFFLRKKTLWIYCLSGPEPENKRGTAQPLYRFPIHAPEKKELIWNKTEITWSNVQLSRDGEAMGGLFPWPNGGVVWQQDGRWQQFGRGCWTSLSPDNSKLLWIFDGLHRNIEMYDVVGGSHWKIPINSAPSMGGFEVYHPRWSNHPRYMVLTGPYEKGEGGNKIGGGGEKVEIHIGRFDQYAKKVTDWLQVTHNNRADFYPDLWIEGGDKAELSDSLNLGENAVKIDAWPENRQGLVFVWEDMKAANQLDENSPVGFYQCNVDLRGRALHSRYFQLTMNGGWADTGDAGKKIGKALAETGRAAIELSLNAAADQQGQILALMSHGNPVLKLEQDGNALTVTEDPGKNSRRWPGLLKPGTGHHLVLLFDGANVEVFCDGVSAGKQPLAVDFRTLAVDTFILGDMAQGWYGTLENIAIYNRLLGTAEIDGHAQFVEKKRVGSSAEPISTLVVEGTLKDTTEIPAPDSIGAYRRALVVNTYSLDHLLHGEYANDRILVAEWAVLDGKIVKEYPAAPRPERLVLEKFDDHPELEGERQMMDIFEPDLEMYYRLPESNLRH